MYKIAVLTICTGRYNKFFEELYTSFEELFLKNSDKQYFVFTDDKEIKSTHNIRKVYQEKLGWPNDTMMRFHMFNRIEQELLKSDFVFFVNANMKAIKEVGEEIIPLQQNDYLMGAIHPGFVHCSPGEYTYDRNPNSTCYIEPDAGKIYYQGCFNGGRSIEFMKMSNILANNIDKDLRNNIIPLWHDESQLNWYYKDLAPLTLPCNYVWPDHWGTPESRWTGTPIERIMIQRDKQAHGGHDYLRG